MKELWNTWRNVAWSVGSGWGTPSATPNLSCIKMVVDFLYVNACHQSRCSCSASRFYCHRRNTCTMGWWHRTCHPNQKMCSFAVPLDSSHRWVHAPQHGSPDRDARHLFTFIQMWHFWVQLEQMKERRLVSRTWLGHSICNLTSLLRKLPWHGTYTYVHIVATCHL